MSSTPDTLAALAAHRHPYLIGVRHHSPALAAVIPALLTAAAPDVVLIELPEELGEWLAHLADPRLKTPVALSAARKDGGSLAFYPFADFSPELAAIRWAHATGVEVRTCDLPLSHRPRDDEPPVSAPTPLSDALRRKITGRPDDDLWDRLVEATALTQSPESIRHAALYVGWALRTDTPPTTADLHREAWMRHTIADLGDRRCAAVIGSFHATALLPDQPATPDGSGGPYNIRTVASARPDLPDAAIKPANSDHVPPTAIRDKTDSSSTSPSEIVTALVPYTFAMLDERSGYPAGIRDPEWQQAILDAAGDPEAVAAAAARVIVEICARVRELGHPAGPGEARETLRLAVDLARLRGLPAPGRGEVVEAIQTVLTHADPLGRGRVVARAAGDVLVGRRTGGLAPGTPRSGLAPSVETLLADLRLPGPDTRDPVDLRLDPLRSDLDARREITLRRLALLGVPYATPTATTGTGGADALTTRWTVAWTPATAATLPVAGLWGPTLALAAAGHLHSRHTDRDDHTPTDVITDLTNAAHCAFPNLLPTLLDTAATTLPAAATLPDILTTLDLLDRLRAGHFPGIPPLTPHPTNHSPTNATPPDTSKPDTASTPGAIPPHQDFSPRATDPTKSRQNAASTPGRTESPAHNDLPHRVADLVRELETAAVTQVDGLAGSDSAADARSLVELGRRHDQHGTGLRLASALRALTDRGAPMIAGAACATRVLLGLLDPADLGDRAASLVDNATTPDGRDTLRAFLTGALAAAEPLLEAPEAFLPLVDRVTELPDRDFLDRLPALRAAFATVGPTPRRRLADIVGQYTGTRVDIAVSGDPQVVAGWLMAEQDALDVLTIRALRTARPGAGQDAPESATRDAVDPAGRAHLLITQQMTRRGAFPVDGSRSGEADVALGVGGGVEAGMRWRLVLGIEDQRGDRRHARYSAVLDELYGMDRGEGADRHGIGVGRGTPFPDTREWAEELRLLFGDRVREEVLAAAVEGGRADAALHLDADTVRPSVDLLRTVLSLAGGLAEDTLARLRPLVARLVRELAAQLAVRLTPALTGIRLPRPSRRPGGGLDLRRTVRANLATARRGADGRLIVVPDRPIFRTRATRSNDWRLVLVVDVSGSMEASTVWAALTAAVFAGVPALTTHFLAFSTEIIDLTDHVADPLSLLLEVRVGGGTDITGALQHARSMVTVPERTLMVVVSDFEEGGPVGPLLAQVRDLVAAGVTLLGCASLDDTGTARYSTSVAGGLAAAGMPVAALSPLELARWVGEKVRG
ncbi:DUF5682 family protein [Actinokineospora enzanensis]|uniref:DUF5682 family protein n=1 Tax=Actinokineospora enzanensis TaxID=155975 RepID=UPI00037F10B0|nr:DUF5682 family protein [Actinokineospora enzanensis]